MKNLLFIVLLCFNGILLSQNDIQTLNSLAKQAKENGELEKATDYYEDLYKKTLSTYHYNELLDTYMSLERYKEAEKLIKKRIKKFPNNQEYLVDLGMFHLEINEAKEAEKYFKEAVSNYDGKPQKGRIIAQKFNQEKLYKYSEQIYIKSQRVNRNEELFQLDLAAIYMQQGKTDEMIDQYLAVIGRNSSYLQYVQNIFSRVLNPDPEGKMGELLKKKTLKIVQSNPNSYTHVELLIWLYLQEENFTAALIQAKAIDKKLKENGKRVFKLGELALANNNYETAENAFEYVISQGEESPYFLRSKLEKVKTEKAKTFSNYNYTIEDLLSLQNSYIEIIDELGKSAYTIEVIKDLAELKAFYFDDLNAAIRILEESLQFNSLSLSEKAKIKILLGDLYLIYGDKWEASLLYSQVEKDFKFDQLGEKAKFKNAKVAFYIGDFYWAQAQLDVLKGSTSKLISNDAMDLSLLITDNLGRDSVVEPLEMFARAELLQLKKDYSKCTQTLDSISKFFPTSSLQDEILMKKYEIAFDKKDYLNAASHLEELIAYYGDDILGDDALFKLANLNENYLDQKEKAKEQYKQLISTFPGSLFVVESRKRFRNLRGDKPL